VHRKIKLIVLVVGCQAGTLFWWEQWETIEASPANKETSAINFELAHKRNTMPKISLSYRPNAISHLSFCQLVQVQRTKTTWSRFRTRFGSHFCSTWTIAIAGCLVCVQIYRLEINKIYLLSITRRLIAIDLRA